MGLALSCLLVGSAAAAKFFYQTPEAYSHAGVTATAREVVLDRDTLKFRLFLINGTGKFMHLEKAAFQVKLANGRMVACTALGRHDLFPGQGHALDLNFRVGPTPQTAALVMSGVLVDGRPYPLPDYVVTPVAFR